MNEGEVQLCKNFACSKRSSCINMDRLCELAQGCRFLKSSNRCDLCSMAIVCPSYNLKRKEEKLRAKHGGSHM